MKIRALAYLVVFLAGFVLNSHIVKSDIYPNEEDRPVYYATSSDAFLLTEEDIIEAGFAHSSSTLKEYIKEISPAYGVDPAVANYIVTYESNDGWKEGTYNPAIRGTPYLCKEKSSKNYGKIVEDRGILQVSGCSYSTISDAVADDPIQILAIMLPIMKKSPSQWSTYKFCLAWYGDTCPIKQQINESHN